MLALLDGSDEHRHAALAAANLFGSTPRAEVTLLASAEVAFTSTPTVSANGNGLMQVAGQAQGVMETVRVIEGRGLSTKLRTTEGSLLHEARRLAEAHDAVVLPRRLADEAESFSSPVIVV